MSEDIPRHELTKPTPGVNVTPYLRAIAVAAFSEDIIADHNKFPPNLITINIEWEGMTESSLDDNSKGKLSTLALAITDLIPGKNDLVDDGKGRLQYPNGALIETLSNPGAVYDIRAISFLTDKYITSRLLNMPDDDFGNFLQLVKEKKLPMALVSSQEMERLWFLRENAGNSYVPDKPKWLEGDYLVGARYIFLGEYEDSKDLNKAIQAINDHYPSESI